MTPSAYFWGAVADEADAVLALLGREVVVKALNPLKDRDFVVLVNRLTAELTKIAGPVESKHVEDALAAMDVRWTDLTTAQVEATMRAINLALRPIPKAVLPKMNLAYKRSFKEIMKSTFRSLRDQFRVTIRHSFDAQDENIVERAARSQAIYITDRYGNLRENYAKEARDIISRGLEEGLRSRDITADLYKACKRRHSDRASKGYYAVVANAGMNRSRTYGQLRGYKEADIQRYEISAVLDENTTDICRMMNGKTFSVTSALNLVRSVDDGSKEVKDAQPWVRSRKDPADPSKKQLFISTSSGETPVARVVRSGVGVVDDEGEFERSMSSTKLRASGILVPPFHGNCRTTILPVID